MLMRTITSIGIERGSTNRQSAMARKVNTLPETSVIIRPLPQYSENRSLSRDTFLMSKKPYPKPTNGEITPVRAVAAMNPPYCPGPRHRAMMMK